MCQSTVAVFARAKQIQKQLETNRGVQTDVSTKLLDINPQFASLVIQSQSLYVLYLDSESNCLVPF
jgi:hypothetical protein